jgi:hypothetical protein
MMDTTGNNGRTRVGGPSPNIATTNHGPCGGCGQAVLQREYSDDGVVKLFDEVAQDYAPWHPQQCARLARGVQAGSVLPTPPRTRWRATTTNAEPPAREGVQQDDAPARRRGCLVVRRT